MATEFRNFRLQSSEVIDPHTFTELTDTVESLFSDQRLQIYTVDNMGWDPDSDVNVNAAGETRLGTFVQYGNVRDGLVRIAKFDQSPVFKTLIGLGLGEHFAGLTHEMEVTREARGSSMKGFLRLTNQGPGEAHLLLSGQLLPDPEASIKKDTEPVDFEYRRLATRVGLENMWEQIEGMSEETIVHGWLDTKQARSVIRALRRFPKH